MKKWTTVNLMLPTYGRARGKLTKFIETAVSMADGYIVFTFVVNRNDPESAGVIRELLEGRYPYHIIIEELEKPHLARYFNMAYEQTPFKDAVVSMLGDDMEFRTQGWDTLLLEWINMFDGVGVFYGDDGRSQELESGKLCTNLFVTREMVDAMGGVFMCEKFPIDDMDVVWYFIGKKLRRLYYIDRLKIFHNHATAPGQMDDVWRRLRAGGNEDELRAARDTAPREGLWGCSEYEDACVERIVAAMPLHFRKELTVVMAVKDRLRLLRDTWASLQGGMEVPERVVVLDDASQDAQGVQEIVGDVVRVATGLGVNNATPEAIRLAFEDPACEGVVVVDSDAYLHRYWYPRALAAFRQTGGEAVVSLHNSAACAVCPAGVGVPGMVRKFEVGGLGMILSRRVWDECLKDRTFNPSRSWDYAVCETAFANGREIMATSPSFIQHTGTHKGTHTSMTSTSYAVDFVGTDRVFQGAAVDEKAGGNKLLFCLPGRLGDIIMGSFIANMLVGAGYNVTWLTLLYYRDIVERLVCPGVSVITSGASACDRWESYNTDMLRERYPAYRYIVNAQPGAPENHNVLFNSGKAMYDFSKGLAEAVIGHTLPKGYLEYARWEGKRGTVTLNRTGKKLALIVPECTSIPPAITPKMIEEFMRQLSDEYDVFVLYEKMPMVSAAERRRIVANITTMQCLDLIQTVDLLLCNDSGMAWAGLLNPRCRIKVYHHAWRLAQTHVYYSALSDKAEDIVVEDKA